MAQLLIKKDDNHHTDPVIDLKQAHKAGDVIDIHETVFPPFTQSHKFYFVDVPGTKADWMYLIEPSPATLRDIYPRSMIAIKRLTLPMMRESKNSINRRKKYSVDVGGNITKKLIGGT